MVYEIRPHRAKDRIVNSKIPKYGVHFTVNTVYRCLKMLEMFGFQALEQKVICFFGQSFIFKQL